MPGVLRQRRPAHTRRRTAAAHPTLPDSRGSTGSSGPAGARRGFRVGMPAGASPATARASPWRDERQRCARRLRPAWRHNFALRAKRERPIAALRLTSSSWAGVSNFPPSRTAASTESGSDVWTTTRIEIRRRPQCEPMRPRPLPPRRSPSSGRFPRSRVVESVVAATGSCVSRAKQPLFGFHPGAGSASCSCTPMQGGFWLD